MIAKPRAPVTFGRMGTIGSLAGPRPRRIWRFGAIDLYLLRGAAGPFALILAAVVVALMLERALRLIHEMAARGADLGYFLPLLTQLLPYYVELAVPLAFMVALVLLVARLDQRLELEAMMANGLSLARIAAPLVALGVVLAGLALWAGGWLEPQGRYGFRSLRIEAVNAGRIGALEPRAVFQPRDDLTMTFDRNLPDGSAGGVFMWQRLEDGSELAVSGASGQVSFSRREQLFGIDFKSGRYVTQAPGKDPASVDFGDLAFREQLVPADASWERGWDQKELTLPELVEEARLGKRGLPKQAVEAEFWGRIARALIIPLVPLLVLPLAFATKRRGRSFGVLLCGVCVVLANHGLNLAKNYALLGGGPPLPIVGGALGLAWLLGFALFWSARKLPSYSPVHAAFDRLADALTRFTPRLPGSSGVRARSLGAYVALEVGKWTLLALVTAAAFLQAVDLVDQGDEFFERSMGLAGIARYAMLKLPAIVQQALPIAALTGAMAGFALLAGRHEITAIRTAGVSQWRLLAMAAPVSLALLAASFALAEWVTPPSQLRLATWWTAMEPAQREADKSARWFRIEDEVVKAGSAAADGRMLGDVRIYSRDAEGRLAESVAAKRAVFSATGWTLTEVVVDGYAQTGITRTRDPNWTWPTRLQPADVVAFFAATPVLSAADARRSLENETPVNRGEAIFATRVHRSFAEPLAPLAMLLFALPLAFIPPRQRSGLVVAAIGAAGLVYLVIDGILTVASQVGYLSPMIGAWTAPLFGLLLGLEVLRRSER